MVLEKEVPVNAASREMKVPRTTLHKELQKQMAMRLVVSSEVTKKKKERYSMKKSMSPQKSGSDKNFPGLDGSNDNLTVVKSKFLN